MWQQDSVLCHTSGKSQKRLAENFHDHNSPDMWPSNSPGCNPMDYYVWGAVEIDTNRTPCNTKIELVKRVKTMFSRLSRDTVTAAYGRFRKRLEVVGMLRAASSSEMETKGCELLTAF